MVGGHYIKSWSTTQKSVTLSSGEAELHSIVRGVKLCKVLGAENPGDLLTKHLAGPDIDKHLTSANLFR